MPGGEKSGQIAQKGKLNRASFILSYMLTLLALSMRTRNEDLN